MKARDLLASDPEQYLAEGIANFRAGLEDLRSVVDVPPDLDPVEWVEKHFFLSAETTGSTEPFKLFGYQRGILQDMCDPEVEILAVPKSTRTGLTQLLMACVAYYVRHKNSQAMVVQPTDLKAQEFSKDYIQPAFRDSPLLSEVVRKPKKGQRLNTWSDMLFSNGGSIRLGWASSDDTFRGRTAQLLAGDEVDADEWEPTALSQGDKFDLFADRGETRTGSRLIVFSSPTRGKTSRIWPLWERSDKQYYFVRCPHCKEHQRLKWGGKDTPYGVKPHHDANGKFVSAYYVCEMTGCIIEDDRELREWMDQNGEWRATEPNPKQRGLRGKHINALYSMAPGMSWTKLWELWLRARGNPQKLKAFFNTKLGEPWEDVVVEQRIAPGSFAATRPKPYPAEVPRWVRFLTSGIDVQKGRGDPDEKGYLPPRLEVKITGWGPGEEFAIIGHWILPANVLLDEENAAALDELILHRRFLREDGKQMPVIHSAMDCNYLMDEVMAYCAAPHRVGFVTPVRGENESGVTLSPVLVSKPAVHRKTGRQFQPLGTRTIKNTLYRRLRQESVGPGYAHFPSSLTHAMPDGYDYWAGLFAEKPTVDIKGVLKWEPIDSKITGEPWDCLCYSFAAIRIAMAQNPNRVGRIMLDRTPRAPDPPYEGEDRSAMADVMMSLVIAKGMDEVEGDEFEITPQVKIKRAKVYATPMMPVLKGPRQLMQRRSSVLG